MINRVEYNPVIILATRFIDICNTQPRYINIGDNKTQSLRIWVYNAPETPGELFNFGLAYQN